MLKILKQFANGISAGILIALGGTVFLACKNTNNIVGAFLFAVALLTICIKGYSLYTGKICYIADHPTKDTFSILLLGLLGNVAATALFGYAIRCAMPNIGEVAEVICKAKLEQSFPSTLIRAILCGILIYVAVDIYRSGKGVVGIIFCIPVFILSGYEHSIADMFYFAAANGASLRSFGYIWTVILGNSIGGLLLPLLSKIGEKGESK